MARIYFSGTYANPANGAQFGRELMVYNGTTVSLAADILQQVIGPGSAAPYLHVGSDPRDITLFNGKLYFCAAVSLNNINEFRTLVEFDPVTGATREIINNIPDGQFSFIPERNDGDEAFLPWFGGGHPYVDPRDLMVIGDKLYFSGFHPSLGRELMVFDGTNLTTVDLTAKLYGPTVNPGQWGDPKDFIVFNGKLIFSAAFDGSGGSGDIFRTVVEYDPVTGDARELINDVPGTNFSFLPERNDGDESFMPRFDNDYIDPRDFTILDGKLHFSGNYIGIGRELLVYDGTSISVASDVSTTVYAGGAPASYWSDPRELTVFGGKLIFNAGFDRNDYRTLMEYDPATGQTRELVNNLADGQPTAPFPAERNDGDETNIPRVSLAYLNPTELTILGGKLYFTGHYAGSPAGDYGRELMVYDGTTVSLVTDISTTVYAAGTHPGGTPASFWSDPKDLTAFEGKLIFNAGYNNTDYRTLMEYDPATGQTRELVNDLANGQPAAPWIAERNDGDETFIPRNDGAYFNPTGLFVYNTTPAGTNATVTIEEDGTKTFAAADFGFTDADVEDSFVSVRIDTLPASGELRLSGALVSTGQVILAAALNNLTYASPPNANGNGYASITFSVFDGTDFDASPNTITFNITPVNDAPVLTAIIPNQAATEDSFFSFQFSANTFIDADGDALTYFARLADFEALPSWLTFNEASRTFSGTPANNHVGTISILVTAVDPHGGAVTDTFDLEVINTNDAPFLADLIPDQNVYEDQPYSYEVPTNVFSDQDIGDTLTYSARLAGGGALPAWLSFDPATRIFSGLARNADDGQLLVEVTADDGNGGTVSINFDMFVNNINDAPELVAAIADATAYEDSVFSLSVAPAFAEVDPGDYLTYSATLSGGAPLPSWLAFDASSGTFSGTPLNGDVGAISVIVTATDRSGQSVSDTFNLTVEDTTGVTITGTSFADTVNATTSVAGQPLPTNRNDIITTGGGNDVISALGGNDTIRAGRGIDIVDAGAGNDTIHYEMGDANDTIDGGADFDTLVISGLAGADDLRVTYNGTAITVLNGGAISNVEALSADLRGGVNKLLYTAPAAVALSVNLAAGTATGFTSIANIANVVGGSGADTLVGTSGANTLDGGAGDDVLIGGAGLDLLIGGSGSDTIDYSSETADLWINLTANTVDRLSGALRVREDNVQTIENAIGGSGNDLLIGNNSANRLEGGEGNDDFRGYYGADTLLGGGGDDFFRYGINDGADTIDGGEGADRLLIFGGEGSAERLDVIFDGTRITHFEGGTLSNVEQVVANLEGGGDRLHYGATTADITVNLALGTASGFFGIGGISNVTGGAGNDAITGNNSTNSLHGGAGDDILTGLGGSDTFVFTPGLGNDTILDFDGEGGIGAQDFISLVGFGITDAAILAARVAFAEAGSDVILTVDGTDTITIANATLAGSNAITDADFIFVA